MVTNSPRNKNFQWFGTENGLNKWKNSRKANIGLRFSGEKSEYLLYRLTDCITSVAHSNL
ncbi:hypothetical protein DXC16_17320 [Phocaeicola vulgatus]|uniref:Uncharacterized protein n=1 Tax=Phocaeicola vulgatus TaxID=821 RepID=A0A3E4WGB0_PHOVU|nr:hypothetical protein DXC16_17320 [Phocaeicola vulgatus]